MHTLDRELQVPDCITHALHDLERNMVDSMISAKGSTIPRDIFDNQTWKTSVMLWQEKVCQLDFCIESSLPFLQHSIAQDMM